MNNDVIYIGVGTNDKLASRLVRAATGSWCSHAWMEYSSLSFGGVWAIHSTVGVGVVKLPILDVLAAYPVRKRYSIVGVDSRRVRNAISEAISRLGTPYDYGVIINAIRLVRWRLTGWASHIKRNPSELHCAELVCHALRAAGFDPDNQLDPEATHPGKLHAFMRTNKNFVEVR